MTKNRYLLSFYRGYFFSHGFERSYRFTVGLFYINEKIFQL
jgi:hypothetical protein